MKQIRSTMIALLSGAVAGFGIGGIGGRFAMRIVANSIGMFPAFTFDTAVVLLMGTIFGLVGGLIFIAIQKYFTSMRGQSIALNVAVFALISMPFFLRPPNSELALNPNLGRLLFAILFMMYSFAVPVIARFLDQCLPMEEKYNRPMALATLVLGAPSIAGIGILISSVFEE